MKEESPASESRQSTKGGSLPWRRDRFAFWKRFSPFQGRGSGSQWKREPFHSPREVNAPDPIISAFFQKVILQLVCTERGLDRIPDGRAQGQMRGDHRLNLMSDHAVTDSEQGCVSNDGMPVLDEILLETRNPGWKRIVDLGILLCTVWFWLPLTMLVMFWVRLASPGPAIYRQHRVGYRGKPFMIFKFRTMHVNAETRTHEQYLQELMTHDVPMRKLDASDPRLVPGGRFLRATGLDELPQIFNVIRGDMSLVGPRPCTLAEFQHYRPEHRGRVSAPPGITGLWQVNGKNKTTFTEMIAMDMFYAKNMSPLLDLAIIWRTIPAIIWQSQDSPTPRKPNAKSLWPT